jgi:SpoVK/Ycf46/Vps4 family AAA+-type ATPase
MSQNHNHNQSQNHNVNNSSPTDGVSPSELRTVRDNLAQEVTQHEIQDRPVKADLKRIRGAIALLSVAKRNIEHTNADDFARHAYHWSKNQLTEVDLDRLTDRVTVASEDTASPNARSQSAESQELSPAEQSAEEVLQRVRQPTRSLQELKGTQLRSELEDVIETLILSVILREDHPAYQQQNIGNVLFTGEPGTGKTTGAEAVASELHNRGYEFQFLPMKGHHFKNHLYGSSQEAVEEIFTRASETGPTVIFIDEFEEVATRDGDRHEATQGITNTLLSLLSGVQAAEDVILIGATNKPDKLDKAIRSRFAENVVEFTEPPAEVKPEILFEALDGPQVTLRVSRESLAELDYTGLVGRSLERAAKVAIQHSAGSPIEPPFEVTLGDIESAVESVRSGRNRSLASQ